MQVLATRIDLIVVGSLSADVARLCADYERRISRYTQLTVHELRAEPTARGEAVVHRVEGERMTTLLDKLGRGSAALSVMALDSAGRQVNTHELADAVLSVPRPVLLIGGTLGLPAEVRKRAASSMAFGRITLPHQMARLVATEQIYRSFRIARGEPYHF